MPDSLTADLFDTLRGAGFTLADGALRVPLELVEVTRLGTASTAPGGRREAFSLVFRGPCELVAPQRIYTLEHTALGSIEVFFVPIGRDHQGTRLEAVFT